MCGRNYMLKKRILMRLLAKSWWHLRSLPVRARRKIFDPGGRKFSRKIKGFVLGLFGQTIEFLRYLGSHLPQQFQQTPKVEKHLPQRDLRMWTLTNRVNLKKRGLYQQKCYQLRWISTYCSNFLIVSRFEFLSIVGHWFVKPERWRFKSWHFHSLAMWAVKDTWNFRVS